MKKEQPAFCVRCSLLPSHSVCSNTTLFSPCLLYTSYSFDLDREGDAVEQAVKQVLKDGYRTIDIMPQEKQQEKVTQVGTAQMGDLICERIR